MKKLLLTIFLCAITTNSFSQTQLPSKLTKGLTVVSDDFDGGIKYATSPATGLTVLSKSDGCTFTWVLSCSDFTPYHFNKVQTLTLGNVHIIPYAESEYAEYSETARVPQISTSGTRMITTFINRDQYIAKITLDARKHIQLLEMMVSDPKDVKIRFCGSKDIDGVFDKRKKNEIKAILQVYNALTQNDSE